MTGYVPVNPNNSAYWRLRLNHEEAANVGRDGSNATIPSLSVALQFPIFAVGVRSNMARPGWWLGAYVDLQIFSGVRSSTNFAPLTSIDQKKASLNKLNYFQFPLITQTPYWLLITFPRWLKHIYLEVWEYTGEITSDNPEISLLEVQSSINRIERKLDIL